jgi:DNA-binding NtrC family response regulator
VVDRQSATGGPADGLHLVVMGTSLFVRHDLPTTGEVTVGRGRECQVVIPDSLASRQHLRLHLGTVIEVEDLGSANGTRVRERKLAAFERVAICAGEAIAVGTSILMVMHNRAQSVVRPVLAHEDLVGRVEWECARAQATGGCFSVMRLHLRSGTESALAQAAARALRAIDVFGLYGGEQYDVLVPGLDGAAAAVLAGTLDRALAALGASAQIGLATYPRDGRHAGALLAKAGGQIDQQKNGEDAAVDAADPAMQRVLALAERAAAGNINVLILGETGAGKEVLARTLHGLSARASRPFVCVDCAALSATLLESELFGHERGAFTGAASAKPGLLETAPGGTVFLDEVGDLPLPLQAKLLRAIENRQITRVGGVRPRDIDVRFVAATNRDLESAITSGEFRRDLYFRLNGMALTVPALRERPADIEPLARTFLTQAAQAARRPTPVLSIEARRLLKGYAWPGNVRELRNTMERALLLCTGAEVGPEHLPESTLKQRVLSSSPAAEPSERERIVAALAECAGNQSRAARSLGMTRKTFIARLESYGVARPKKGAR